MGTANRVERQNIAVLKRRFDGIVAEVRAVRKSRWKHGVSAWR
jgi:hypothetical protein